MSQTPTINGNSHFYPPFYTPLEGAPNVGFEGEIEYPFEDVTGSGDENKIRGNWSTSMDFILSCLGFAVGLGNIWRFPYYAYINGGGAFLIPYLFMLIFAGLPMFFMELALGQFASLGCVSVWKVCPLFKGVGIAMFIISCFVAIYYNMIMACNHVLEISNSILEIGGIRWQLALCLLVSWAIVFLCLFKSVKSSGKVVYVTTVAPYIILLVLLVRALTLKGSIDGVVHFISFRWEKLLEAKVWGDAAVQVFFSLSTCWGGLITLASYNRFHNNCYRDMWVICIGDALSSVFAGLVIFATLGTMAYQLDVHIDKVAIKGPGLPFVVFAEALARLPFAPVWATLFFTMIIMLGIDTQFCVMETVVTSVCDEFPERLRKNHRHVLSLFTVIFYICGVPFCTQAGMYIFQLCDYFCTNWSLLIIAFFECMAISWVYGTDNFMENLKWMLRFYPPPYIYWKVTWKFLTPLIMMAIMLFTWIDYHPLTYGDRPFPESATYIGWGISFASVLAIPLMGIYKAITTKGSCFKRARILICPEEEWGPALAVHRAEQYPLQVPENREPLKHCKTVRVEPPTDDEIILPNIVDFDKETAI